MLRERDSLLRSACIALFIFNATQHFLVQLLCQRCVIGCIQSSVPLEHNCNLDTWRDLKVTAWIWQNRFVCKRWKIDTEAANRWWLSCGLSVTGSSRRILLMWKALQHTVEGYSGGLLLLVMDMASRMVIRRNHTPERGSGCACTGHFTGH